MGLRFVAAQMRQRVSPEKQSEKSGFQDDPGLDPRYSWWQFSRHPEEGACRVKERETGHLGQSHYLRCCPKMGQGINGMSLRSFLHVLPAPGPVRWDDSEKQQALRPQHKTAFPEGLYWAGDKTERQHHENSIERAIRALPRWRAFVVMDRSPRRC